MSIFTETFPQFIQEELTRRQERLSDPNKRNELVNYQTTRNAWVRMTSGVEVNNDGGALAKKYVLQSGVVDDKGNFKVGIGTSFDKNAYSSAGTSGNYARGIRPMPGITGVNAECKTAYGSLFEATVNFVCWDIKQLEDLELLFMRPGYTVLLEWGWNYKGAQPKFYDILSDANAPLNFQKTYKELYDKCQENSGNYEAILGYVKNYQWSARPDGGYDCTTNIIALGEVLESLKLNYAPLDVNLTEKDTMGMLKQVTYSNGTTAKHKATSFESIKDYYSKGILSGLLFEIQNFMTLESITSSPEASALKGAAYPDLKFVNYKGELKSYSVFKKKWDFKNTTSTPMPQSALKDDNHYYISLGSLCDLVNEYVIPKNINNPDDKNIFGITTKDRMYGGRNGEELECLAHPLQTSTDVTKVLIKGDLWINGGFQIKNSIPKPDVGPVSPEVGEIVRGLRISPQFLVGSYIKNIIKVLASRNVNDIDGVKYAFRDIRDELVWSIANATDLSFILSNDAIIKYSDYNIDRNNLGINIAKLLSLGNSEEEIFNRLQNDVFDSKTSPEQYEKNLNDPNYEINGPGFVSIKTPYEKVKNFLLLATKLK